MKKKTMICISLVLAVLCVFALFPRTESQGIFYRVSNEKNEIYVLGSIHIGSKHMYPFHSTIQKALKSADALIFECDTQSEHAQAITRQLMNYAKDASLKDHLSTDVLHKLELAAQKLNYDMQSLLMLKPWAVTSLFSMETLSAAMGVRDVSDAVSLGVENKVRSQTGDKETIYLETVEEQLSLMDQFSPALQEMLLAEACAAILDPESAVDEDLQHWPLWWSQGNAQAFAASYLTGLEKEDEPLLAQEYHESLITQRNRQMAKHMAELLEKEGEKRYFATIGLMHLVLPEDSVLFELESMGYRVEKIQN